jgi:hypothetical protein
MDSGTFRQLPLPLTHDVVFVAEAEVPEVPEMAELSTAEEYCSNFSEECCANAST